MKVYGLNARWCSSTCLTIPYCLPPSCCVCRLLLHQSSTCLSSWSSSSVWLHYSKHNLFEQQSVIWHSTYHSITEENSFFSIIFWTMSRVTPILFITSSFLILYSRRMFGIRLKHFLWNAFSLSYINLVELCSSSMSKCLLHMLRHSSHTYPELRFDTSAFKRALSYSLNTAIAPGVLWIRLGIFVLIFCSMPHYLPNTWTLHFSQLRHVPYGDWLSKA